MRLLTTKAIEERFFKFIKSHHMFPGEDNRRRLSGGRPVKGVRTGVGVSGGPDSVCLALLMKRYQKQLHIDPVVLHVNHHLRGKESDRDEQFVRDLSKNILGFECVTYDVHLTGKELKGNSLEALAREKRYKIFGYSMRSLKLHTIVLAHTMNDNAETVLINMLRGTGITGFSGIPPVREGFVRPMLGLSRDNVLRYLELKGVPSVTDSTNELPDYLRNRIRHEIIPNLMQINPGFFNHTLALSDDLREIDTFLNKTAQQAYGDAVHQGKKGMIVLDLEKLLASDSLIVKLVIQIAVKQILGTYYNPRREHIDSIMAMLGKTQDNSTVLDMFPEGLVIYKDKKHLIFDRKNALEK